MTRERYQEKMSRTMIGMILCYEPRMTVVDSHLFEDITVSKYVGMSKSQTELRSALTIYVTPHQ